MAGLEKRPAEAEAALGTLDQVAHKTERSLVERDGAILRLIYTFDAVWKACRQLLAERENIDVASPNATIRAARRLGWPADDEAKTAMSIGRDRNLAVHMYRGEVGAEIARRVDAHAELLRAGSKSCEIVPLRTEATRRVSAQARRGLPWHRRQLI
jgi:nucleotidyltransferase-like protein